MRSKLLVFVLLLFSLSLTFVYLSNSYPVLWWRMFTLNVTADGVAKIEARPGDTVIVNGSITNIGRKWVLQLKLSSDCPFEHEFVPNYFKELPVRWGWDPEIGNFRKPESFILKINVPENASGEYEITITGQELFSALKVTNSTSFTLDVKPVLVANISIIEVDFPEKVIQDEPFNISVVVMNEGNKIEAVNITLDAPTDWEIPERSKYLGIEPNVTRDVIFTVTPTTTAGNVTIYLQYPYKQKIVKIVKTGPYLKPLEAPKEITIPTTVPKTGFQILVEWISSYTPIVAGLAVLIVVLIAWKITSTYKFKIVRGKEEKFVQPSA